MMSSVAQSSLVHTPACQRSTCFTSVRPGMGGVSALKPRANSCRVNSASQPLVQRSVRSTSRSSKVAVQAGAVELYQLADEGALIGGTAAVLFACTLIGLAVGFVLLRVEALVEEGKI